MIIMWSIIGVLWTVLMLILGMAAGKVSTDKNDIGEPIVLKGAVAPSVDPKVFNHVVDELHARVKAMEINQHQAVGEPGPPGPDFLQSIVDPDIHLTGAEWKAAVENRLTRVERKAGLSV